MEGGRAGIGARRRPRPPPSPSLPAPSPPGRRRRGDRPRGRPRQPAPPRPAAPVRGAAAAGRRRETVAAARDRRGRPRRARLGPRRRDPRDGRQAVAHRRHLPGRRVGHRSLPSGDGADVCAADRAPRGRRRARGRRPGRAAPADARVQVCQVPGGQAAGAAARCACGGRGGGRRGRGSRPRDAAHGRPIDPAAPTGPHRLHPALHDGAPARRADAQRETGGRGHDRRRVPARRCDRPPRRPLRPGCRHLSGGHARGAGQAGVRGSGGRRGTRRRG